MQKVACVVLIVVFLGIVSCEHESSHNRYNLVKNARQPRANPCPNPEDILPCSCSYDEEALAMDINCSAAQDEEELKHVFQANIPNKDFRAFIIENNPHLRILENGVFGDVRFERIDIMDGVLEVIEDVAFTGSASTVWEMNFHRNNITVFPFLSLREFISLENLNLHYNNIKEIPEFESASLKKFYIYGNPLAHFPQDSLIGLPHLETFGASEAQIPEIYPGVFDNQLSLRYVYLQKNSLSSIPADAFRTQNESLFHIVLDDNMIVEIAEGAFPTMKEHTSIFAYRNRIRILDEKVWRHLVENGVTVWLSGNPLNCGCDVAWAVLNPDLLKQFPNAHCETGTDLDQLDPGDYTSC